MDPRSFKPLKLYYCDHHSLGLPPGHKFPAGKYALIRERLARDRIYEFVPAPLADPAVIKLVHDARYVDAFLEGTLSAAAIRRIGFPWSIGLVNRTLGSVGGTLEAARDACETGWGGNLAGGTHHAFRAEGSGFCVFNDIAVAIAWLRSCGRIRRAAVLDLDVHQGDGTAALFETDADVLTTSIHCAVNFPFRKQRSKVDIELPAGVGDEAYLNALDPLIANVLDFAPDIVFYQSGVDGLGTDRLGRLKLTPDGLMERDRRVITAVARAGLPFVITLGGGYSEPIELTAEAHANTYRVAALVFGAQPGLAS